jgi:hypothetical protein
MRQNTKDDKKDLETGTKTTSTPQAKTTSKPQANPTSTKRTDIEEKPTLQPVESKSMDSTKVADQITSSNTPHSPRINDDTRGKKRKGPDIGPSSKKERLAEINQDPSQNRKRGKKNKRKDGRKKGDKKKKVSLWQRLNLSNVLAGLSIIGSVLLAIYVFMGKAIMLGLNVLWGAVKGCAARLCRKKPEDRKKGVVSYFVRSVKSTSLDSDHTCEAQSNSKLDDKMPLLA